MFCGWVPAENSNHYNVAYGDGIYKSEDGGKSWKNMGIKTSEHIGGIAIDPENSNIVYAAAMGSLRKGGGERGIFGKPPTAGKHGTLFKSQRIYRLLRSTYEPEEFEHTLRGITSKDA